MPRKKIKKTVKLTVMLSMINHGSHVSKDFHLEMERSRQQRKAREYIKQPMKNKHICLKKIV